MTCRRVLASLIVMGVGTVSGPLLADDAPKPAGGDEKPAAAAEPPKKKESFFGKKFSLYVETRGGPTSFQDIDNSLEITQDQGSQNQVRLGDGRSGQLTLGWTLPRERGQFLFTYTAIGDDSYEVDATGFQRSYTSTPDALIQPVSQPLPWWSLHIANGQLHTVKTAPYWDPLVNDTNGNGLPDPNEIQYPTTTFDETKSVASKLNNRISTYDMYYRREFGGVRYHAKWTAGARYLTYDGTLPTPTWLNQQIAQVGVGYSDGFQNQYLLLTQKTRGWGPVGSAEFDVNFARRRFQLYAIAQAAFLLENLETESGPFTYLATVTGGTGQDLFPGEGQISEDISKSAWNTMFELGFRVRVREGFHIYLAINRTGYLDTLLEPTQLSVPANDTQVDQGVSAVYTTRDIVVTNTSLGLSFQF